MNRARADASLLLVAFIWGTAFVAQKEANSHLGPLMFVAVRFIAAAMFLLPLALWERRRMGTPPSGGDWRAALCIATLMCAGCIVQQVALVSTNATHAGFLTAVYMVIVPFVAWIFSRRPPRALVMLACAIALAGAWLMGGGGAGPSEWSRGDIIILASDLIWALHITLIGHFRSLAARPMLLSTVQCAMTGLVALPFGLAWQPATGDALLAALPAIAYASILSSGVAFTLQIVGQRHTPAAEAALILSLESVFAAIAGAWLQHDSLSLAATIGAGMILLGVVLVETGGQLPALLAALRGRLAAPGPRRGA
jgi:drug/metabolite transporter (DMT)-like permease